MVDFPSISVRLLEAKSNSGHTKRDETMLNSGDEVSKAGRLVCNEMSRPRLQRLQRVMSSFLPAEMLNAGGR